MKRKSQSYWKCESQILPKNSRLPSFNLSFSSASCATAIFQKPLRLLSNRLVCHGRHLTWGVRVCADLRWAGVYTFWLRGLFGSQKKTHLTVTVSSYLLLQDGKKHKTCHTSKRFPLNKKKKKKNHLQQQLYNSWRQPSLIQLTHPPMFYGSINHRTVNSAPVC